MKYLIHITFILCSINCMLLAAKKVDNNTFVATHEWQEVKEGQAIPAGLHVRINFKTGKKEAKLLDEENEQTEKTENNALAALPDEVHATTPPDGNKKSKSKHLLSDALKNAPKDALAIEHTPESFKKIKRDYKSYKVLKETYEEMRKHFKTDAEIITKFVHKIHNISHTGQFLQEPEDKIKSQMQILNNLYFMVDQIDNAVLFVQIGGLDKVLLPMIVNETHIPLRVEAIRVLGALTQNNPKAKIAAFERNVGEHLSRILMTSMNTDELNAAIYAFGSFIRKFPNAQRRILSTSGVPALINVLTKECELKIKTKALTIISDLLVELRVLVDLEPQKTMAEDTDDYTEHKFAEWLQANSFCQTVETLIPAYILDLLAQADIMEYFLEMLENTHTVCTKSWSQNLQLHNSLSSIQKSYFNSKDEHRLEISERINALRQQLYKNKSHEEL